MNKILSPAERRRKNAVELFLKAKKENPEACDFSIANAIYNKAGYSLNGCLGVLKRAGVYTASR